MAEEKVGDEGGLVRLQDAGVAGERPTFMGLAPFRGETALDLGVKKVWRCNMRAVTVVAGEANFDGAMPGVITLARACQPRQATRAATKRANEMP